MFEEIEIDELISIFILCCGVAKVKGTSSSSGIVSSSKRSFDLICCEMDLKFTKGSWI